MWNNDPVMLPFKTAPQAQSRLMGFAGQPDKKAAEAWNKYVVTVMYAQACSGKMKPEEACKWAAGELSTAHLATHNLSLDEAPLAYDMFKRKTDGCVRAVIRPNG